MTSSICASCFGLLIPAVASARCLLHAVSVYWMTIQIRKLAYDERLSAVMIYSVITDFIMVSCELKQHHQRSHSSNAVTSNYSIYKEQSRTKEM